MTQSKSDLEKALKLSRKLRKETASIQELTDSTEKTLDEQETKQGPKDHDEQLKWVQVCQYFNSVLVLAMCSKIL